MPDFILHLLFLALFGFCITGRLSFPKAVYIGNGALLLWCAARLAEKPDVFSYAVNHPVRPFSALLFILLNLVLILYLPRKLRVWQQLLVHFAIGALPVLWLVHYDAVAGVIGGLPLLQPYKTFCKAATLSLLVTALCNIFTAAGPYFTFYPIAAFHRRFNKENLDHPLLKWFLGNTDHLISAQRLIFTFSSTIIFYGLWLEAFR